MKKIIGLFALLLTLNVNATIITHGSSGGEFTWNNGLSLASVGGFDWAEFSFASEFVDTITLANFGSGIVHDHGTGAFATIDVFDGSSWTNVFTSSVLVSDVSLSSLFASPVTFIGMNISGLRLGSTQSVGYAYHNVNSAMTYTIEGTPVNVPAPTPMALFALALTGIALSRKKVK